MRTCLESNKRLNFRNSCFMKFYVYMKLNQQIFGKMQPKETADKL